MAMEIAKKRPGDLPSKAESACVEAFGSSEKFKRNVCLFQLDFRGTIESQSVKSR